jgi:simple sugar transport system ATP-binding protein
MPPQDHAYGRPPAQSGPSTTRDPSAEHRQPALALSGISKRFGTVQANRDINLAVEAGTVHGIVGENGAGKSTLMSIIYGFYEADSGSIAVDGKPVRIRSSMDAIGFGIGMVHQHFMLAETMSVLDNVMLGAEGAFVLRQSTARARAALENLERQYGLAVDPDAIVGDLSVGLQQRVEILKALYRGANILILDEPTAVLTPAEADQLFVLVRALAAQGKTVLLITHKLREIMAVTDTVSVMRRGEMVATLRTASTTPIDLAEAMVGRRVLLKVEKGPARPGDVALDVEHLTVRDGRNCVRLHDLSFSIRAGEIVGVAGVAGNGQSELLEAIAGMRPATGKVSIGGEAIDLARINPDRCRALRLHHVPEDRQKVGLVMPFQACESGILGHHREGRLARGVFLDQQRMLDDVQAKMVAYDVRPPLATLKTAKFSGGNQQKIVLAREIERDPLVLLIGQPTRGVDIGAIEFIHKRIVALRDAGKAILLVSVELDEIMSLSDRILVLCGGRLTGERRPETTTEQELGLLMAGVSDMAA